MQAGEQEKLSIEEKSKLFVQLLEARKKYFAAIREKEKRNKPPTKAQKRSTMSTYLKNIAGYKHNQLKNKSFDDIQKLFDKAMKRVNTFIDMDTKLVKGSEVRAKGSKTRAEGSSKREGEDLQQESTKKQKVDDDKESEELKKCLEIILDDGDDVTIDATPLSTKYPTIMLKNFKREGLEVLWSIVKARFKKIEPVNYMDNFLLLKLKTMFEHHVEDNVWKNQQGLVKVLNWKLYDSCGVHCVTMQNLLYYLLVEKMYPLINHTLHHMFNDLKLQVDYECEMAFELLRLVKQQLKDFQDSPDDEEDTRSNEEDVSSNDNEMIEVKVLMTLVDDESVVVGKESARNGEWVKISMKKVHTLLDIEDNDERKSFLDYLCIDPDDTKVSIPGVERPWLSEAEGFTLPNHDTGRIFPAETQVKLTDPSVSITDSLANEYDSADESSVCSTPLFPLEKLAASKNNAAPTGKLKNVKTEDDSPLSIVMKELNDLKLNINKNQSSYSKNNKSQQIPQNALQNKYKTQFKKNCELCGLNNHLFENCYKVLFCKKCERTDHKTCDHAEYMSTMNIYQHLKSQGGSSSRSKILRPSKPLPLCIHSRFNDHMSDDCINYPICDIYGSYDHDTHGHNRLISLRRGIKPINPQHINKSYETYGSTVHTTTDHNDIEWFRRGEAL
ncbi:hypothetical protein Tco_1057241 [Tanacetum coccineum]|uniref:Uncharacterized protein n=1 Tax=Tanacetum coccineum TaxID=301880 RepID=A0ABQ5H505_9ASTR